VRLLLAVFLAGVGTAWADGLSPTFEMGTSFVWGQSYELVLRDGTYDSPISRLVWETPPLIAGGLAVDWPWSAATSTRFRIEGGLPVAQGTMTDEDWDSGTILYDKSTSSAQLTTYASVRAEQTLNLRLLRLYGGLQYRVASWEAWGGTYDYHQTDGDYHGTLSGMVLAYRQEWLIPYLGTALVIPLRTWTLTPSVELSPYTWGSDTDDHTLKQVTFHDETTGGFWARLAAEALFPGTVTWGIRGAWELAWGAVGDTTSTQTTGNVTTSSSSANTAGMWFHEGSLSFFVRN